MSVKMEKTIREVSPRPTVQIHLPQGRVLEGPRGTSLADFLVGEGISSAPVVGAIVNGELRELIYPIEMDSRVRPVTMGEPDGMRIYRRSLTFLIAAAFAELYPGAHLHIDHSVSSGGYYCEVSGRSPLEAEELGELEGRMHAMVDDDLPFAKSQVPLKQAIEYFQAHGFLDKCHLLQHRRKPYLVMYQVGNFRDYHHGYMVPSTGYLKWFALAKTGEGFTLRFPRRHRPTELLPLPEYPKLLSTFRLYGNWLNTLGISSVGSLNDAIVEGRSREIILVAEALHEHRIAEIATRIRELHSRIRLVLVAGPSASGKTTFSKRLSIQLLALGVPPLPIELDNFFVDREKSPRDEKGDFDYEALEALDLERLNQDLRRLINGEQVRLPRYDFKSGLQREGNIVQMVPNQVIILEGIHGLNPNLVPELPSHATYRIYVSALTQLNLDRYNRVSTTDTRLIRRIVRDAAQRDYSAQETIKRWESVRRGEKRYIFPFQENADVMFNSALVYEGSMLASRAEPLLRQVPFGTDEHVEAKRLLAFLEWFLPLNPEWIPENSILREFIDGSILQEFSPWRSPLEP